MDYRINRWIDTTPSQLFQFLCDKERSFKPDAKSGPVLSLDKLTPGEPQPGTRYREVVQMLPFYSAVIESELLRLEPGHYLEERWSGPAMDGTLSYRLSAEAGGTRLLQRQSLYCRGWLRLLGPLVYPAFAIAIRIRLRGIKRYLESQSDSTSD